LYSPGCLGSAQTYLGMLAATYGDHDAAAGHFEAGLAMNERMGARPLTARTQQAYARMLLARGRSGDRDRAAALVAAARETAQACGMAALLSELAADGVRPAAVAPSPGEGSVLEATLRQEAQYWTIAYGHDAIRLKDTKGLVFLHTLLQRPGQDV